MSYSLILLMVTAIVFFLLQPCTMYYLVLRRRQEGLACCIVFVGCFVLAYWSSFFVPIPSKHYQQHPMLSSLMALFWMPLILLTLRFLHAWNVGGLAFCHHFGLVDTNSNYLFSRIIWCTLSPCVILFQEKTNNNNNNNSQQPYSTSTINITPHQLLQTCLVELILLVLLSVLLLETQLVTIMPGWAQRMVYLYFLSLATAVPRLVHELPVRYALHYASNKSRPSHHHIIPLTMALYHTSSPRDLWRRWSMSPAYHLRKGFYEPLQQRYQCSTRTAMVVTFAINALLHIYLWGYMITPYRYPVYDFGHLLLTFPILSVTLQDGLTYYLSSQKRLCNVLKYLVFVSSTCWVLPYLIRAQALPPTLNDFCHLNTFLLYDILEYGFETS